MKITRQVVDFVVVIDGLEHTGCLDGDKLTIAGIRSVDQLTRIGCAIEAGCVPSSNSVPGVASPPAEVRQDGGARPIGASSDSGRPTGVEPIPVRVNVSYEVLVDKAAAVQAPVEPPPRRGHGLPEDYAARRAAGEEGHTMTVPVSPIKSLVDKAAAVQAPVETPQRETIAEGPEPVLSTAPVVVTRESKPVDHLVAPAEARVILDGTALASVVKRAPTQDAEVAPSEAPAKPAAEPPQFASTRKPSTARPTSNEEDTPQRLDERLRAASERDGQLREEEKASRAQRRRQSAPEQPAQVEAKPAAAPVVKEAPPAPVAPPVPPSRPSQPAEEDKAPDSAPPPSTPPSSRRARDTSQGPLKFTPPEQPVKAISTLVQMVLNQNPAHPDREDPDKIAAAILDQASEIDAIKRIDPSERLLEVTRRVGKMVITLTAAPK